MEYISAKDNGAQKIGNTWVVPKDTPKPSDKRKRQVTKHVASEGDKIC